MSYAVGIPTRLRQEMLSETLEAVLSQSLPPALVVVVDNNGPEEPVPDVPPQVVVVKNDYEVLGPEQGHQTALRVFRDRGIEIAVRWDDDLVPEHTCMQTLVSHLYGPFGSYNACGGCYPRPGKRLVWSGGPKSGTQPPDGHPGHVQFYRWSEPGAAACEPVPARHLYSGMAYRVDAAVACGGFCVEYSQLGYRGETDFSLRIGSCLIDPGAVAIHHLAKGGTRSLPEKALKQMAASDEALFIERMASCDIDVEGGYWK